METVTKKEFKNFRVEKAKNGFILEINSFSQMISDEIYVFNTLEQMAEFIKKIEERTE